MRYPQLNLKLLFEHQLRLSGIQQPTTQVKAECQLLRQGVENALEKLLNLAIEDQSFSRDFAPVINKSPQPVGFLSYENLLGALAAPGQSLIMLRPHKKEDIIWQGKGSGKEWRGFVRPFPVDPANLVIRRRQIHYAITKDKILTWDRAAAKVPTGSLEALMRFRDNRKERIRAVVADKDGVVVMFNVVAHDYLSWRKSTNELWTLLTKHGVTAERFKLGRLVPISRESRGRGALLYLA